MAISSQELGKEYVASVPVKSGLFALKYVSSASERPPRVFVRVSPSSSDDVTLVFLPGLPKGVLEGPTNHALVVAEREGNLHLTVVPCAGGGSSARVQLEPFSLDRSTAAPESDVRSADPDESESAAAVGRGGVERGSKPLLREVGPKAPAASHGEAPRPLSLTCHVARHGDVSVASGVWVGGPEAPAVIEGVTLDWVGSDGSTLEYQALMQGAQGRWSPWARAGEFLGSRAKGLALVGLRIRIAGGLSDNISLSGEAVFLGCPVVEERGRALEFVCAPQVDPMVGLRIEVCGDGASAAGDESNDSKASPTTEPASPGAERGALKIFRSRKLG